jgi:hypothetical protein
LSDQELGFRRARYSRAKQRSRPRRSVIAVVAVVTAGLVAIGAIWLGIRASQINHDLTAALDLVSQLKKDIAADAPDKAEETAGQLQTHTSAAREAATDPVWTLASTLPVLGSNFSAVAEITRSADDVANLGIVPLVDVIESLNWQSLLPTSQGTDLQPLEIAAPNVSSAAHAVRASAERLESIDSSNLLSQVSVPLELAKEQLGAATDTLDAAADAAILAPGMLGGGEARSYLLMIQNNAEVRASGGIPGALAVLSLDEGRLALASQSSAGEVGVMAPPVSMDTTQQQIYSGRIGKYMQDANLTPDFPTAAGLAAKMWERKTGEKVDGVISVDPVALGYLLDATGPIDVSRPELSGLSGGKLPVELNSKNVVTTLLSDVYSKIEQPKLQDAYFAGVANEIFAALSGGKGDTKGLVQGISRGAEEGRVLLWSNKAEEQAIISKYSISGAVDGPSVSPAQFGVYFNDGTGAKMDYYVERRVQLVQDCPVGGYEQITVRVTSTNTAPLDAATTLPAYVTGAGVFGVPPGTVQTNVVVYGPTQANVEEAKLDGQQTQFAPHLHSNRPVGIVAVQLAPGESKQVEFTFGKIVQHTEPNVVVTPTIESVNDVILPTEKASCG